MKRIKMTRIKVYKDSEYLTEFITPLESHSEALSWYRKIHPEFEKCVLIAETVDPALLSEDYLRAYYRSVL